MKKIIEHIRSRFHNNIAYQALCLLGLHPNKEEEVILEYIKALEESNKSLREQLEHLAMTNPYPKIIKVGYE